MHVNKYKFSDIKNELIRGLCYTFAFCVHTDRGKAGQTI